MNMISTGAFLKGMDASEKQETVVSKLVSVWEKKNAKAARAGGVSLMALSLAACGSDDDTTTTSTSTSDTTTTTTTTADAAQTLVLTASGTTGSLDYVTGGSGDDTINGLADGFVETGDYIDGGAGTDTVNSRFINNGQTIDPTLVNIEKLYVTVDTAAGKDIAVDGSDVTSEMWLKNANDVDATDDTDEEVNFNNVALTTTVGIEKGEATVDLTVAFASVTGTADSANVSLVDAKADTLTIAGVETLNFTGSGTSSTIDVLTAAAATKVTIAGSGKVVISDIADTVTTIDASASTGGVDIGDTGNVAITFTGGSGDDRVAFADGELLVADTVDGGAGTDTLATGETAVSTAGDSALMTELQASKNIEVLELMTTTAESSLDAENVSTINTFLFSGSITDAAGADAATSTGSAGEAGTAADNQALSITGIEDGDVIQFKKNIDITGGEGGSGSDSDSVNAAGGAGAAASAALTLTPEFDTGSNSATIELNGGNDITGGAGGNGGSGSGTGDGGNAGNGANGISATGFETITINSTGAAANSIAGGAGGTGGGHATSAGTDGTAGASIAINTNGKIIVTGDKDINIGTISGTNASVDGSAFTGKLTATGEAGVNEIKGGSAVDTLDGAAGIDILTGGAGADVFKVSAEGHAAANGAAYETITDFEAGVDKIDHVNALVLSTDASATATVANAAIDSEGFATFAGADDTLGEKIQAAANALYAGTEADGQVAIFTHAGDTYVFVHDDAADGNVAAGDTILKLAGVTGLSDVTIDASGNMTIA